MSSGTFGVPCFPFRLRHLGEHSALKPRYEVYCGECGSRVVPECSTQAVALMIKLPDWADRISTIRVALGDRAIKFFDRRQVGELFGISPARAARLIHGMGPMLHGNSLIVDAEDIRKLLSEMERDREIRDLQWQLAEKSRD